MNNKIDDKIGQKLNDDVFQSKPKAKRYTYGGYQGDAFGDFDDGFTGHGGNYRASRRAGTIDRTARRGRAFTHGILGASEMMRINANFNAWRVELSELEMETCGKEVLRSLNQSLESAGIFIADMDLIALKESIMDALENGKYKLGLSLYDVAVVDKDAEANEAAEIKEEESWGEDDGQA